MSTHYPSSAVLFSPPTFPHQPVVITDSEDVELLVVQVEIDNRKIRIINGYGPQEDEENSIVQTFWQTLETEIITAREENCLIIIEIDANAKIGREFCKDDLHNTSKNGKILLELVSRQGLNIANLDTRCSGLITRQRNLETRVEKSIIDYIIVCDMMIEYLDEMIIDEDRNFTLRHSSKKKNANEVTLSDHNILFSKFSLQFKPQKPVTRREFFNFKSEEGKKLFFIETDLSSDLSSSFSNNANFEASCNLFYNTLQKKFHKCFKKIRVKKGAKRSLGIGVIQARLFARSRIEVLLKTIDCPTSVKLLTNFLKKVEDELVEICAQIKAIETKQYIGSYIRDEGKFDQIGFWKLKKKLCPSQVDPPMAKRDSEGTLITAPEALKKLHLDTYTERLKPREMQPALKDIFILKTLLWKSRLQSLKMKKTAPWNLTHLDRVLSSLKNNKTRDPNDMISELFKEGCIGNDLQKALLYLFNGCKDKQAI